MARKIDFACIVVTEALPKEKLIVVVKGVVFELRVAAKPISKDIFLIDGGKVFGCANCFFGSDHVIVGIECC